MKKKVKHMLSKLLLPLTILSCNHALSKAYMNMPNPASVTSEKKMVLYGGSIVTKEVLEAKI